MTAKCDVQGNAIKHSHSRCSQRGHETVADAPGTLDGARGGDAHVRTTKAKLQRLERRSAGARIRALKRRAAGARIPRAREAGGEKARGSCSRGVTREGSLWGTAGTGSAWRTV
jgi:hypothetical protein